MLKTTRTIALKLRPDEGQVRDIEALFEANRQVINLALDRIHHHYERVQEKYREIEQVEGRCMECGNDNKVLVREGEEGRICSRCYRTKFSKYTLAPLLKPEIAEEVSVPRQSYIWEGIGVAHGIYMSYLKLKAQREREFEQLKDEIVSESDPDIFRLRGTYYNRSRAAREGRCAACGSVDGLHYVEDVDEDKIPEREKELLCINCFKLFLPVRHLKKQYKRLRPISFPDYRGNAVQIDKGLLGIADRRLFLSVGEKREEYGYYAGDKDDRPGRGWMRTHHFLDKIEREGQRKRAKLYKRDGSYYLAYPVSWRAEELFSDDIGIVVVGLDSICLVPIIDGRIRRSRFFSLGEVNKVKNHMYQKRKELGRKKLRWKIKELGNREERYVRTALHTLSRRVVDEAVELRLGHLVALNMKGVKRAKYKGLLSRRLGTWPVRELLADIEHKATLEGVVYHDRIVPGKGKDNKAKDNILAYPRHSRVICPGCGENYGSLLTTILRKESHFHCPKCGFEKNLSIIVAENILSLLRESGRVTS